MGCHGRYADSHSAVLLPFQGPANRVVREQPTGSTSVTEGIGSDYGVNYGSGTSTLENDNGAFKFSCGPCSRGHEVGELLDGTSNVLLMGEKHVTRAGLGVFDPVTGAEQDFSIYWRNPAHGPM